MKPKPLAPTRSRLVVLVATLALALLAPLLAAAPAAASSNLPTRTHTEMRMSWAIRNLMNSERRAHHLAGVHMSPELLLSARRHNVAMARANTMSHQLRGEAGVGRRISGAGYHWSWSGENIAYNSQMSQSGVLALGTMMYREKAPNDGHRLNILGRHFRDVGVDVYLDHQHHKVWLTVDFGHH